MTRTITDASCIASNESSCCTDRRDAAREFEVTVLTTRSGTTVVVIAAADHEAALAMVREGLASGDFTAPPEHCTDDVQTEIWTIRELSQRE